MSSMKLHESHIRANICPRYDWRSLFKREGIHWKDILQEVDEGQIPQVELEEYETALQDLVNIQGTPTGP